MTDLRTRPDPHGSGGVARGVDEATARMDDAGGRVPPPPPNASQRPRQGGWKSVASVAAFAALVGGGVAVPVTLAVEDDPTASVPATTTSVEDPGAQEDLGAQTELAPGLAQAGGVAAIAADVSPSVARVDVVAQQGRGSGSAVVYREDGYLLTNNHVVQGADRVQITLPDGTEEDADVVGTDPRSDLAVLKVDRTDLPVPEFTTEDPEVGATAVAIGAPFGLEGSVTAGIVSALGRSVSTPGAPLVDLIQTDAPINPGNSGGALVDAEGRVMGVNTAILSPSGGNNGIGFAIPMRTAQVVADQLIDDGTVEHAFLGVQGTTVDPQVAEQYGLATDEGAVIAAVTPNSPADEAGLRQGDIVVAVDGEEVASMADLAGRIGTHRPGDRVELEVVRSGEALTLDVELAEAPQN